MGQSATGDVLTLLADLAALALLPAPREAEVLAACSLLRRALDADDVYVVRAGDPHYVRVGSDSDPTQYDVKQKGYWLVWQACVREPELQAVLADVQERLLRDVRPARAGNAGNYLVMVLPGDESNSEMLVVRRGDTGPVSAEEFRFLKAARSPLSQLVARALDTARQDRQKRQLSALSEVVRAFSKASKMDSALNDLATAIAKASGFDWVSIYIYDADFENVVEIAQNVARHSETETAAMGRDGRLEQLLAEAEAEARRSLMRQGRPILRPDVFAQEAGVTPELRAFYERAHILSRASFPLLFQHRLVGMINYSSSTPRQFDESEVAFLGDLAAQAATAVQGLALYRDLEHSRNEVIEYAAKLEETSRVEHFLARTDALTGIPNRRYLEEVLVAECARADRDQDPLSIVMSDLDDFKSINDSYGHAAGDEALRLVAQVARGSARTADFVGRWGGDEFLFILPQTSSHDALAF